MATTAAASTLALLALYGAALIFLLQTLTDRYGPAIFAPLLRRKVTLWVGPQVVIALVALVLIGVPMASLMKSVAAAGLLATGLAVSSLACYRTWLVAADRRQIAVSVNRLPESRRPAVVRELVWIATGRSDVEMVHLALRIFERGSKAQIDLLNWLLGHHPIANREWLAIELLHVLMDGDLDEDVATAVREPLLKLLGEVLDDEDFTTAYEIIHMTMRRLRAAHPFTDRHGQLMLDVARSLWLVGDHMGDAPRTARIGTRLDYLKSIYLIRRNDIFHTLLDRRDASGLTVFVAFLCLSIDDISEDDSVFSLMYAIAVDAHKAGILEVEAINELGNTIGHMRFRQPVVDDVHLLEAMSDAWNRLVVRLALAMVDLRATDEEISHMLGNCGHYACGDKLPLSEVAGNGKSEAVRRLRRLMHT